MSSLDSQMQADRIKWLKSIASTLLKEEIIPQKVDVVEDVYAI